MDPREVLLNVDIDELIGGGRTRKKKRTTDAGGTKDETDLLVEVKRLRRTVEHDHDHRLKGIEINIRWLMVLVGGEVLAIVGYAIGSIAGG